MNEHTDKQWGELRSALHAPSTRSWQVAAEILAERGPEHEALCAYAMAQLERWPREIVRPVPDLEIERVLEGSEPAEWVMRTCNALHLVKWRRRSAATRSASTPRLLHIGHVPGLITQDGTSRLRDVLAAFADLPCVSFACDELEWGEEELAASVAFLHEHDDIQALSLAHVNLGKRAYRQVYDAGAFARLERLCLDGNHVGRHGVKQLLSSRARWSGRSVRSLSWQLASFGSGELARLVRTTWFGELEHLNLRHNALQADGLRAWSQVGCAPRLEVLEVDVELGEQEIRQFGSLGFLARLQRLYLRDLPSFEPREPLSGEAFTGLICDSVWRDTLEHLTLGSSRPVTSFHAFETCCLPDTLTSLNLSMRGQTREAELACERLHTTHPGVIFRVANRVWSPDEDGVWGWRYDGTPAAGERWWREVDEGRGWR